MHNYLTSSMLAGQYRSSDDENPSCGCSAKLAIDPETGEKICTRCGVVLGNEPLHQTHMIDHSIRRVNGAISESLLPNYLQNTVIDRRNVDSNGRTIAGANRFNNLRKLLSITVHDDPRRRNLETAMKEITRITQGLGINEATAQMALDLYRKAYTLKLIRGRSILDISAASICLACSQMKVYCSLEDIARITGNRKRTILRYLKFLTKQLGIRGDLQTPRQSVSRIAQRAGLSGKIERSALALLTQVEGDPRLSGKKPVSLAAAALYLTALENGEYVSQIHIANAADLTVATIGKRASEIDEIIGRRLLAMVER